jgi:hypothetical protein
MGCFQWFAESHEKHKHEQAFLIGSRMLGSWGQATAGSLGRSCCFFSLGPRNSLHLLDLVTVTQSNSPSSSPQPCISTSYACHCLVIQIANGGVS